MGNDEIAQAEPAKQERAAAVAAAEAAKAQAVASADTAKAEAAKAQQEKQDAAAGLKAAKKAWVNFYADMKKLMDDFDNGPRELADFQATVIADLKDLETLAPPPPEPEEEEAAAADAPVAEDAAQPDA